MKKEILLLKIIDSNASISLLSKSGLSYSQIFTMIDDQRKCGNIDMIDNRFILTDQGKQHLTEQLSKEVSTEKDRWIVKQEHHYRDPISTKTIILPKKKKYNTLQATSGRIQ